MPQGDEQFVFRVADGRANRIKIDVGQRRGGKVEVLKGLTANDLVVTAGHLKIRDGTPVTILNSPASASASPPAPNAAAASPPAPNAAAPISSPDAALTNAPSSISPANAENLVRRPPKS